MKAKKMEPPERRRGGKTGGRRMSPELIQAMRTVANNPDEWFLVAEYRTRGSASSMANRMRGRDWDAVLGLPLVNGKVWDIVSRSYEEEERGAGVWARYRTGVKLLARAGA